MGRADLRIKIRIVSSVETRREWDVYNVWIGWTLKYDNWIDGTQISAPHF